MRPRGHESFYGRGRKIKEHREKLLLRGKWGIRNVHKLDCRNNRKWRKVRFNERTSFPPFIMQPYFLPFFFKRVIKIAVVIEIKPDRVSFELIFTVCHRRFQSGLLIALSNFCSCIFFTCKLIPIKLRGSFNRIGCSLKELISITEYKAIFNYFIRHFVLIKIIPTSRDSSRGESLEFYGYSAVLNFFSNRRPSGLFGTIAGSSRAAYFKSNR